MRKQLPSIFRTIAHLFNRLMTSRESMLSALIAFVVVVAGDLVFFHFVGEWYLRFLERVDGFQVEFLPQIDAQYGPIVWTVLLSMVLSTLIIVITFASQNIPKLIDLYLEDRWSLLLVWFIIMGTSHSIVFKVLNETGGSHELSTLYNQHFLLVVFIVLSFPFIFNTLSSTKPQNVIAHIFKKGKRLIRQLASSEYLRLSTNARNRSKTQQQLLEMMNQLYDLLEYVPFKEPKADIVTDIGNLLCFFADHKSQIPDDFFILDQRVREDISFKTLTHQLDEVEAQHLFYEQKGLRLIGNAYNTFLEEKQFDLSTLCASQLSLVGSKAIQAQDKYLMDLVQLRFNTHFRFALKHGIKNNEPRNLYNLAFHYGRFVHHMAQAHQLAELKAAFFYLKFYSVECYKSAHEAPALSFILDTIGHEMSKILVYLEEENFDYDLQKQLLGDFLQLDNPPNIDRKDNRDFFLAKSSVRIVQIGLGLHYLSKNRMEFVHMVVDDTLADLELIDKQGFLNVMRSVFNRLRFSGRNFWEDTDRGNLNIYYTPHADQIDQFAKLQEERLLKVA